MIEQFYESYGEDFESSGARRAFAAESLDDFEFVWMKM